LTVVKTRSKHGPKVEREKEQALIMPKSTKKKVKGPKRACTAYSYFLMAKRAGIKTANPDATFGDIARLISAAWKKCSDDDKKEFVALADADKIRATKDKQEWDAGLSAPQSVGGTNDPDLSLLVVSYLVHTAGIPLKKVIKYDYFAHLAGRDLPAPGTLESIKMKLPKAAKAARPTEPPATGYKIFCRETKSDYAAIKNGPDATKARRAAWEKLNQTQQDGYDLQCSKEKQEFYEKYKPVQPPATGYQLFCRATKSDFVAVKKGPETTKARRAAWEKLSQTEQNAYDLQCHKEKYSFYKKHENLRPEDTKVRRRKKDPNRPVRPVSAFVFYINKHTAKMKVEHPGESYKQIQDRLKTIWKDESRSTEKLKKKFGKIYQADVQRYAKEMENYTAPPTEWEMVTKKRKKIKDPNRPKKNLTAYTFYMKEGIGKAKAANPGLKQPAVFALVTKEWNKMNDAQKKKFQSKAKKDQERYAKEMAVYDQNSGERAAASKIAKDEVNAAVKVLSIATAKRKRERSTSNAAVAVAKKKKQLKTTTQVKKPNQQKKATKKKEPEKKKEPAKKKEPVKKKSAFDHYCDAKRGKYAGKNPTASEPDLLNILRKKFKAMSADRMLKYTDLAK
jgi:hypothetical protein